MSLLQCPAQADGPHPHAARRLRGALRGRGDLDALPGDPRSVHRRFDPVTVSATGTWRGRPTAWHKTYPNACALDAATGSRLPLLTARVPRVSQLLREATTPIVTSPSTTQPNQSQPLLPSATV